MYRFSARIILQYEDTRSLRIFWVIFDDRGLSDSREHVSYDNIVFRQFVVTVVRHSDFLTLDEVENTSERIAHHLMLSALTRFGNGNSKKLDSSVRSAID